VTPIRTMILGTALLAAACGTDPTEGCTEITEVRVGGGLTPTFDWSPRCGVHQVVVYEAVSGTGPPGPGGGIIVGNLMWEVQAAGAEHNTIRPSVIYGELPSGAVLTGGPQPLVAGTGYVVIVSAREPDQFEQPFGMLIFTP
jgi:hypothetical protein